MFNEDKTPLRADGLEKKTLVVASGNAGKIREIASILSEYNVVGYKQLGFTEEIEETGESFYENALIKAKTVSDALGLPALADDSGLCVDALHGAPGIYSARYAGDGSDESNIDKLLLAMKDEKDRSAKFVSAVVLYYPDGKIVFAQGETEGEILYERKGTGGFGYDPVFFSKDLNKSFGEASACEKNAVSHRGRALAALRNKL